MQKRLTAIQNIYCNQNSLNPKLTVDRNKLQALEAALFKLMSEHFNAQLRNHIRSYLIGSSSTQLRQQQRNLHHVTRKLINVAIVLILLVVVNNELKPASTLVKT